MCVVGARLGNGAIAAGLAPDQSRRGGVSDWGWSWLGGEAMGRWGGGAYLGWGWAGEGAAGSLACPTPTGVRGAIRGGAGKGEGSLGGYLAAPSLIGVREANWEQGQPKGEVMEGWPASLTPDQAVCWPQWAL